MKLIKDLKAVPKGAIYPVTYAKGEECPKQYEALARKVGALPARKSGKKTKEAGTGNADDQTVEGATQTGAGAEQTGADENTATDDAAE